MSPGEGGEPAGAPEAEDDGDDPDCSKLLDLITIAAVARTEETKVTAEVSRLAFDERMQVSAAFADEEGLPFAREVLGAKEDGSASHTFLVPAQSRPAGPAPKPRPSCLAACRRSARASSSGASADRGE
jgi:hypothetical protein